MKVFLRVGVSGAQEAAARGEVVVAIDALRASVTITTALAVGAVQIIPLLTVAEARAYLDQEGYLVAGERGGVQIEGFHFGNSPTELERRAAEVKGKTLVLTTSSGTCCVEAAQEGGAAAVLTGSLPNATAYLLNILGQLL